MSNKFVFIGCTTIDVNGALFRLLLARHLICNGHEVHFILQDSISNREWINNNFSGVQTHFLSSQYLLHRVIEKRNLIKKIDPDIVHILGAGVENALIMPLFQKTTRTAYIIDFDELLSVKALSPGRNFINRHLEYFSLKASQAFIGASHFLVNHFSKTESGRKKPSLYLPYAYDPKYFTSINSVKDLRNLKRIHKNKKIIIYMGSLDKVYQGNQVLKIASHMSQKYKDLVFWILGKGSELEASKRWVVQQGLTDSVCFLGYISPKIVPAYLQAADVLLFPIENNLVNRARCPNKTFQYIAANRPVVTNRVSEVEYALGDCGYYYDFNNLDSCEEALLSALTKSKTHNCRFLLEQNTWVQRSKKYENWLVENQLLNQS